MSNWGALWALDAPIKIASVNPQGNLSAPVGTMAVRPCDGSVYIKLGGGNTAFGWYLFNSPQWLNFQPRWLNGVNRLAVNANAQTIDCGAATIVNFLPQFSTAGTSFSSKRSYVGGYTSGVVGNSFLYRLTTNTDSMPTQRIDDSLLNNFQEFDLFWDVVTTPRGSSAASSTDLADTRLWIGGGFGSTAVQAVGGTVSSDTLATEWPTMLSAADGLFAFAFRFSTVAGDAGWQLVTTRRAAGAYAQTVTPMGVAVVANTAYRLRMRFVFVAGVLTCLASINDGTEIAVTANVGPIAPFTANQIQPFQPLASCRNIVGGVLKSFAVAQCSLNYGVGVGQTC